MANRDRISKSVGILEVLGKARAAGYRLRGALETEVRAQREPRGRRRASDRGVHAHILERRPRGGFLDSGIPVF